MKLTATDYILLAYLNNSAVHGYRLAELLEEDRLNCWSRYSLPHLYYSLRRLAKNGYVKIDLKAAKARPPQKVYSLTKEGAALIKSIDSGSELIDEDQYFAFDLLPGLADKLKLDTKTIKSLINRRLEHLNLELGSLQEKFREKELKPKSVSDGERLAFKHRIRFLKGEIDFYRKSLKDMK